MYKSLNEFHKNPKRNATIHSHFKLEEMIDNKSQLLVCLLWTQIIYNRLDSEVLFYWY